MQNLSEIDYEVSLLQIRRQVPLIPDICHGSILEGNSDVRSCNLMCLKHLIRSRTVTNQSNIFSFMRARHVPSNHII